MESTKIVRTVNNNNSKVKTNDACENTPFSPESNNILLQLEVTENIAVNT